MPEHRVSANESIPSIARDKGFFWKTLWNHASNAELKTLRKNPNQLLEGDVVFVPELRQKEESCATEALHEFKRKGDPVKFKLQLRAMGKPRKNEDYVLKVGAQLIEGVTDGDGKLETFVPGNAKSALLMLKGGQETHRIRLSRLDPIETLAGVQQRLNNLGFPCGRETGKLTPKTTQAIQRFQEKYRLPATGKPDPMTQAKLKSLHT